MTETTCTYISVEETARLLEADANAMLIDARTNEEFAEAHANGAINVAIDDLPTFAQILLAGKHSVVITMCGSAGRGEKAEAILSAEGVVGLKVLDGGLKAWREAGFKVG